jgi:hypothetical protein
MRFLRHFCLEKLMDIALLLLLLCQIRYFIRSRGA